MLIETCVCGLSLARNHVRRLINNVPLVRCECGVIVQITPTTTKEQIEQWYSSGRYHEDLDRHPGVVPYTERLEQDRTAARLRIDRYRRVMGGLPEEGDALDVGCANGAFLQELRIAGVNAFGVDPDPRWSTPDGIVLEGNISTYPGGEFDLITYHDVLEHLVDPLREIRVAKYKLNPGGWLVIEVPDVYARGKVGERHIKFEHLWYFTARSMIDLVVDAGYKFMYLDFPIPGKMAVFACRQQ